MKQKIINFIVWLLPCRLVSAITMHGLRNNKLHHVAPYVLLRMTETGLNTPDATVVTFNANMDIMGKRHHVWSECRWEEIEPLNKPTSP